MKSSFQKNLVDKIIHSFTNTTLIFDTNENTYQEMYCYIVILRLADI